MRRGLQYQFGHGNDGRREDNKEMRESLGPITKNEGNTPDLEPPSTDRIGLFRVGTTAWPKSKSQGFRRATIHPVGSMEWLVIDVGSWGNV